MASVSANPAGFTLRDIPAAMTREGWFVGAALMRRWLAGPAWTMDVAIKTGDKAAPPGFVDSRIVTMAWALRFSRMAAARERLIASWAAGERRGPSARQIRQQLNRWLAGEGRGRTPPFRFGDLDRDTATVDRSFAINREIVDSPWYGIADDLYAALGRALVKIAVSGEVSRASGGGLRIAVDRIGTFVRDTYDFNGDQPLGSWGPDGLSRAAILAPEIEIDPALPTSAAQRYWSVNNGSFRRYRSRFSHGADFIVYSDIMRSTLASPIVLDLPA